MRAGAPQVAGRAGGGDAARGRGVSRAVLARLEHHAVALGYRRLQLETGHRQPEAIALSR
ncbi:MAG TPA: GNAT family N-acetyltransferase [Acidimicrobiales bacterium]|nr:GNAT family N-acetyltransferase [Acidimicrobiales bacterium]